MHSLSGVLKYIFTPDLIVLYVLHDFTENIFFLSLNSSFFKIQLILFDIYLHLSDVSSFPISHQH